MLRSCGKLSYEGIIKLSKSLVILFIKIMVQQLYAILNPIKLVIDLVDYKPSWRLLRWKIITSQQKYNKMSLRARSVLCDDASRTVYVSDGAVYATFAPSRTRTKQPSPLVLEIASDKKTPSMTSFSSPIFNDSGRMVAASRLPPSLTYR